MSPRKGIASDAVAFVYARISLARDDLATKRQVEACRQLCAARGWTVAGVYVDESISAYNGKTRPEFERMLADATSQSSGVVIVAWDLDRLVRRVKDVGRLIDLYHVAHVPFVTVQGGVDMTSAAGKLIATILTAVAEMESEHKAERLRLRFDQDREAGRPHWSFRPFGFELDGAHRVDEAAIVRDCYALLNEGATLSSIAQGLTERGILQPERRAKDKTMQAKPFTVGAVRDLLRAHRNVGVLYSKADKSTRPGAWEPIVDEVTFSRAQRALDALVQRHDLTRKHDYLLTGHIVCERCGKTMHCQPRKQGGVYRNLYSCRRYAPTGHVGCGMTVTVDRVDGIVSAHVLDVLDDPANRARIVATSSDADGSAALDEISEVQEARARLVDLVADGLITQADVRAKLEALAVREERARARLTQSRSSGSSVVELPTGPALREAWDSLPLAQRRAIVVEVVEPVRVRPPAKAGRVFDVDRVTIVERYPAPAKRSKRSA